MHTLFEGRGSLETVNIKVKRRISRAIALRHRFKSLGRRRFGCICNNKNLALNSVPGTGIVFTFTSVPEEQVINDPSLS